MAVAAATLRPQHPKTTHCSYIVQLVSVFIYIGAEVVMYGSNVKLEGSLGVRNDAALVLGPRTAARREAQFTSENFARKSFCGTDRMSW